jgi:hypothetical protein
MRSLASALVLLWVLPARGAALNVEFKFTPYTGDTKADHVESVAGTARVFVDGVPIAEQPVRKQEMPVMFDAREIAAAVWIPVDSLGPAVRKGKNTIRIEFEPMDASAPYKAQLTWATVTDQVREGEDDAGSHHATNQADEGVETKDAKGKLVMEREFTADFAKDQAWHHYPAVTSLDDADKAKLVALLEERASWFEPDFAKVYAALATNEHLKVADVKQLKCLDAVYAEGLRLKVPPVAQLEFVTTGNPEVVVRRKGGDMLYDADTSVFDRIEDDDVQMCAGVALVAVYPPHLIAVRGPDGAWRVAY